jgi:hypothetical protein
MVKVKELPRYKCHKVVHALMIKEATTVTPCTITPVDNRYPPFIVDPKLFSRYMPSPGDYYVVYEDGYASFSPKKAFEEGYARFEPAPVTPRPTIAELETILRDTNSPPVEITPAGEVVNSGLRESIRFAINSTNAENGSNTADYILADYLVSCLAAFDRAVVARTRHALPNANLSKAWNEANQSPIDLK